MGNEKEHVVLKTYSRNSDKGREDIGCTSILRSPGKPKSLRQAECEQEFQNLRYRELFRKTKLTFTKTISVHYLLEDDPDR